MDDRPVFPQDRACAEAWAVGGLEAEKAEREAWRTRDQKRIQDSVESLLKYRKQAEAERLQREAQQAQPNEAVAIDPETVDWLYGQQEPAGAQEDGEKFESERTCERDVKPEPVFIRKRQPEESEARPVGSEESIFGSRGDKGSNANEIVIVEESRPGTARAEKSEGRSGIKIVEVRSPKPKALVEELCDEQSRPEALPAGGRPVAPKLDEALAKKVLDLAEHAGSTVHQLGEANTLANDPDFMDTVD